MREFINPKIDIITFETDDLITTSNCGHYWCATHGTCASEGAWCTNYCLSGCTNYCNGDKCWMD